MGGTKRMSAEEKRNVILNIYHSEKSVYTEKEILALAVKAGVNAGTVADIHNSMVDDGLVEKQKISGSNYFWSFPSKKDRMAQLEHQRTAQEVEELQQELEKSNAELADAKRGREDDDGSRPQKLARLGELAKERVKLEAELASLKANDPQALADLEKEVQFVTNGANRWTDNIFNVQSFLVKKKGMGKKEVNRLIGITDAFDYPEDKK